MGLISHMASDFILFIPFIPAKLSLLGLSVFFVDKAFISRPFAALSQDTKDNPEPVICHRHTLTKSDLKN